MHQLSQIVTQLSLTNLAGDSGSGVVTKNGDGSQTVYGVASYNTGRFSGYPIAGFADAFKLREDIEELLEECS